MAISSLQKAEHPSGFLNYGKSRAKSVLYLSSLPPEQRLLCVSLDEGLLNPEPPTKFSISSDEGNLDVPHNSPQASTSGGIVESSRRKYPKDLISQTSSALQISGILKIPGHLKKLQNTHEAQ
ncbi:hypothetical protein TNCV_2571151 [Trichonephila clavipes]|nr:hypothetical protein TNCV_2571151 [Trichonephila clavipes]